MDFKENIHGISTVNLEAKEGTSPISFPLSRSCLIGFLDLLLLVGFNSEETD